MKCLLFFKQETSNEDEYWSDRDPHLIVIGDPVNVTNIAVVMESQVVYEEHCVTATNLFLGFSLPR